MQNLIAKNISKNFDGKNVLENVSYTFNAGSICCIMGESGVGKTTFLKILLGLIKPDGGQVSGLSKPSVMFQEDRLLENMNAIDNVRLVLKGKNSEDIAEKELEQLLPKESLRKAVSSLSGGMKRRVALVRAMTAESDIVMLDEPFSGLDKEMVKKAVSYILDKKGDRTVLVVTHNREACEMLKAEICLLTSGKPVATIS